MIIECRARSGEPIKPTYLHRFGRLLHDVHRLLAIHVKLMSLVATDHASDKTQNNDNLSNSNNKVHEKDRVNNTSHLTNTYEHRQQQQQHNGHQGNSN